MDIQQPIQIQNKHGPIIFNCNHLLTIKLTMVNRMILFFCAFFSISQIPFLLYYFCLCLSLLLDLKRASPISSTAGSEHRCATLKSSGVLQGRLLNVPLPNPSMQYQATSSTMANSCSGSGAGGSLEDSNSENHSEAYHWDCSDWVRRSHNPLPNITEVPGSEVPDSSSFHSNESNESQCKQIYQSQS